MVGKRRERPFKPSLDADWRGGPQIADNIRLMDHETGRETFYNLAESPSQDPHDPENISGKYLKIREKENESILKQNLDRTSGR